MSETFERLFTRDDGAEVTVEIVVTSWGCGASYWHPEDPPESEPGKAYDEGGAEVRLTDAEWERAERQFWEDPPEPDYYPED